MEAMAFVKNTALRGGVILFVGTKKQSMVLVEAAAKSCAMPYVDKRWLGGTLTNFASISQVLRKYKDMKRRQEKGEFGKYTKFEQLKFGEQIKLLDEKVGGIQDLVRVPDAVFILDIRKDKTALEEAKRRGVKVLAICDTNVDPSDVDYPIPCNDDAVKAITLIVNLIAQAIKDGRAEWESARARLGGALVMPGDKKPSTLSNPFNPASS